MTNATRGMGLDVHASEAPATVLDPDLRDLVRGREDLR